MLGSPGSSTPCDLGWVLQIGSWHTPSGLPPPVPGAGAAGGAHLSPTRPAGGAGPALARWQSAGTPQRKITSLHSPLLGMGTERTWETCGQRATTGCWGLWKCSDSFHTRGRWTSSLQDTQVGSGQTGSVLGCVDLGLLGSCKAIAASF